MAHHYLHMARGNFREYLSGSEVWVKKYCYVLRPLLAVKWIEAGHGVAPMASSVLVDRIIAAPDLKDAIARLVEAKRLCDELDRGPMIPVVTSFIERELARLETSPLSLPGAAPPIEPLNDILVKVTSKRQVTFPARVLEHLGVKPGDRLELQEGPEGFLLRPRRVDPSQLAPLRGKLRRGKGTFDLEAFRGQPHARSLRD